MQKITFKGLTQRVIDKNGEFFKARPSFRTEFQCRSWFGKQLRGLCDITALHGYSQIVRDGYSMVERTVWTCAVVASTISAITLLMISWSWSVETPTVTVTESTNYPTWNLPFPAVTVCNLNKISASAARSRAETMRRPGNMTVDELAEMFRLFLHVTGLGDPDPVRYRLLHDIMLMNNLEIPQLMGEFTPPCGTLLERCMWKGTQWRCDNLFQVVNSTEGLCCSFNYYGLLKDNYPKKITVSVPKDPRRVMASGYQTGLSVLLQPHAEDYHSTDVASYGFKVMIHSSYDYPDNDAEIKLVLAGTESFITLRPTATYATDDALDVAPSVRNCYSRQERVLGVMQRYSYVNCMVECRAANIYAKCGCVPYHLPNNGSMRNCEMKDMECVVRARDRYVTAVPTRNGSVERLSYGSVVAPCGCLPGCDKVQYPSEMVTGRMNRSFSFNAISFFKDIQLQNQSLVHIYLADLTATHFRMDIYQDSLGVLASFGGILGLFLGFSIITGFEMVYYFSIRLLFDAIAKKSDKRNASSAGQH
ncbi:sodium channel protein Nach-like [Anopheles arabiensis]|uniref:sodium channel protein Nach-like n=1 Tax=Anopheles arabiensis TaxID=7173 RepID=UPI001AAC7AFE|nr:sodium channel protein Nach-like [Anopheles arabiensis]